MKKIDKTIQLRGRYHAKIRIPKAIQNHYGGKTVHQESLKTSDPKEAEKKVRAILAVMDAHHDKHTAEESWQALARTLPSDQKALLDGAGGLSGLLKKFEAGKTALAFMEASGPTDVDPFEVEGGDVDGGEVRYIQRDGTVLRDNTPPTKILTDNVIHPDELQIQSV